MISSILCWRISELMYTERDFIKDLEYLHDFWIKPLRLSSPSTGHAWVPEQRREKFPRTVVLTAATVPTL